MSTQRQGVKAKRNYADKRDAVEGRTQEHEAPPVEQVESPEGREAVPLAWGALSALALAGVASSAGSFSGGGGGSIAPTPKPTPTPMPEPTRPEPVKPAPITPATKPIEFVEQKAAPQLRPRLTNDTGASATDGYTRDATIFVHEAELAEHGWEYRIGEGDWRRGSGRQVSEEAFPTDGAASVAVRALDPQGRPWGKSSTLDFHIDRTSPSVVTLTTSGEGEDDLYEVVGHEPGTTVLWAQAKEPFRPLEGLVLPVPAGATIRVLQRDRAGNDSPVTEFIAPARERIEPGEGESEPSKPPSEKPRPAVIPRLLHDTGRTDEQRSDGITSDATVLIDGIDPAVHHAVRFRIGDGEWQKLLPNATRLAEELFGEGLQAVTVEALDQQGAAVGPQQALHFTVDRVRPPLPVIVVEQNLGDVDDKGKPFQREWSGKSNRYSLTRDAKIRIDGIPEGGTWTYAVVSGDYAPGSTVPINRPGSGTHFPASALKPGPNTLFVDVFDQAGNGALSNVVPFGAVYLDARAPAMPPSSDGAVL